MSRPWVVSAATARDQIPSGALESWTALYRRSPWAGAIPNNLFDAVLSETYRQLLGRGAQMYLAVNPANPGQWLGYQLVERTSDGVPVVHAAFTKSTYRRAGVQASLFAASGIDRTGRLFYSMRIGPESKFYPAGRFAPEIARRRTA